MGEEIEKRKEFEEQLFEDFPFMRGADSYKGQEKSGEMRELYGAFDFGMGWYDVLREMCNAVTVAYERAGLPVDIVVYQAKEKFGKLKLRFYYQDYDPGTHSIDSLDGCGLRAGPGSSELHQEVAKIVEKWEAKSMTVCEICGSAGEMRTDLRWVKTLCERCYSPRKQKIDEWRLRKENKDGQ
jgi:hypothetical protein